MDALAARILELLQTAERVTSDEIGAPLDELHGCLLSLAAHGRVTFTTEERPRHELTAEGRATLQEGSAEYRLFTTLPPEGLPASSLADNPHGLQHAFRKRWVRLSDGIVTRAIPDTVDDVRAALESLSTAPEATLAALRRRNLARPVRDRVYVVTRGPAFAAPDDAPAELTAAMLASPATDALRFKRYNFDTAGPAPLSGALHPLMKMRVELRRVFLELGFSEMRSGRYVESSFWNFDSLFQPQNHPARDAHDTFFLATPAAMAAVDEAYCAAVQKVHTVGARGSVGHCAPWSRAEAMRNVLRTHTTSLSARYLRRMAEDPSGARVAKLFSIDKVFRNESVDATHLAEFYQVEGVVAGRGLGIGDLMGLIEAFFARLGLHELRFKPAFNPYTEPSMEIFGYHPGLGKWIEIGNSGVFRPEMLETMGLEADVTVLGWGLSLERPAMIKYGLSNIRDLVGHRVDVEFVRNSEFVCL